MIRLANRTAVLVCSLIVTLFARNAFAQHVRPPEAYQSGEAQLAASVIAAANDEQRSLLISAQPQLINQQFRHALAMQILRLTLKGEHARVLSLLAFARKLAAERQDQGWVAMTWIDSAGSLELVGRLNEAMAAAMKTANTKAFEHDRMALAHVEGMQAFVAYMSEQPELRPLARQKATHSLTLFAPEQKLEIGLAYAVLGMLDVENMESENAPQYLQKSIQMFEEMGERFWSAIPLNSLGEYYHHRGDALSAVQYLQRSADISEEFGIHFLLYYTTNQLGHSYRQLGDATNALRAYEISLREREMLGDKRKLCVMFSSLADLYTDEGHFEKGLEYAQRGLQLALTTQYHSMAVGLYSTLGSIYFLQGNRELEMQMLEKGLEEGKLSNNKADLMSVLSYLGSGYERRDDLVKSLQLFQQVIQLNETLPQKEILVAVHHKIGWIYYRQHDFQQAMNYFNQTQALLKKAYSPAADYTLLNSIGEVHFERQEYAEALAYFQKSFALAQKYNSVDGNLSPISANVGKTQHALKQYDQALASFEQGMTYAESWQRRVIDPDARSFFLAWHHKFFEHYLELLMDLQTQHPTADYTAKALEVNERARARALLDLLTESQSDLKKGVDESLLERERDVHRQINGKSAQLALVGNQSKVATLEKEIALLTIERKNIESQIRLASPHYAALARPQPLTTKQIQAQVLDDDTLLLEYQLGEKQCWLWAVTPNEVTSYALPARMEIEKVATRVRQLLINPKTTAAEYNVAAQTLSQMILSPVADKLGHKRLLIVADGILQYLPFGALPVPNDEGGTRKDERNGIHRSSFIAHPLIADHEIINLPSASLITVLRQELAQRKPAPKSVAVLADPVFSADDSRLKNRALTTSSTNATANLSKAEDAGALTRAMRSFENAENRAGLARLMLSRDEAQAISSAVPAAERFTALDFQASRANAMSATLSQYRIVHFATHGLLNAEYPELSGLVFSLVDEKGNSQDGFLRLHEIYNLKLPAELVVLSACQTGLGKDIKGEGLIGLTRGFMYAGAARVVASLWRVDDYATSVLMKKFYRGMLQEKLPAAAALRKAQIEMWQQKQWQSPFYWSGFVLQGEWR